MKTKLRILPAALFMLLFSVTVNIHASETEEPYPDQMENISSDAVAEDRSEQDTGNILSEQEADDRDEIHFGWYKKDNDWYYYSLADGRKLTGWQLVQGIWYYMDADNPEKPGVMLADQKKTIGNADYFFAKSGAMQTGWIKCDEGWYYTNPGGAIQTGWQRVGNYWYYLDGDNADYPGLMVSGERRWINNAWFCFEMNGSMQTGWVKRDEGWYYTNPGGAIQTGWQKVGNYWYYMDSSGIMQTGWKKLNEKWYYLKSSGDMVSGRQVIDGSIYYFDNYSGALAEINLEDLIRNALLPLGKTLYVWGGGWNVADTAAGEAALHDGVWPEWETYFQANKNGYSYRPGQTSWKNGNRQWRLKGLDCSGYLGWLVYNSVIGGRNPAGYVVNASRFASSLANYSFGTVTPCTSSGTFLPGDIISLSSGHCYLVLGQCSDGSVLLMHSTPNGGVQVSGTVKNSGSSQASQLAQQFMRQNYPEWWISFGGEGRQSVNAGTYLNGTKFSWQMSGSVSDPAGIRNMTGEQILDYLKQ